MLHIPKPCHQDWNEMTPTQQGAFCRSCQKEVIDFTAMTDDEVLQFLNKNNEKKLCGKATASQVNRLNIVINENVLHTNIRQWKKYLAILLICFGSSFLSCNNKEVKYHTITGVLKRNPAVVQVSKTPIDTLYPINTTKSVITVKGKLIIPFLKKDTFKEANYDNNKTGDIKIPPPPPVPLDDEIMGVFYQTNPTIDSLINSKKNKIDSCAGQIFS